MIANGLNWPQVHYSKGVGGGGGPKIAWGKKDKIQESKIKSSVMEEHIKHRMAN